MLTIQKWDMNRYVITYREMEKIFKKYQMGQSILEVESIFKNKLKRWQGSMGIELQEIKLVDDSKEMEFDGQGL